MAPCYKLGPICGILTKWMQVMEQAFTKFWEDLGGDDNAFEFARDTRQIAQDAFYAGYRAKEKAVSKDLSVGYKLQPNDDGQQLFVKPE